jgi:hypothetical protein
MARKANSAAYVSGNMPLACNMGANEAGMILGESKDGNIFHC